MERSEKKTRILENAWIMNKKICFECREIHNVNNGFLVDSCCNRGLN